MTKPIALLALLVARPAMATLISDPGDPMLAGAVHLDLSGGQSVSPTLVTFTAASLLVTATGFVDPAFWSCSASPCFFEPSPNYPVKLQFDRPVDAVGIWLQGCYFGATNYSFAVSGDTIDDAGVVPCPAGEVFAGAGNLGDITLFELRAVPPGDTRWHDLYVHLASPSPSPQSADLSLTGPERSQAQAASTWVLTLDVTNHGSDGATGVELISMAAPNTQLGQFSAQPRVSIGDLPSGQSYMASYFLQTPPRPQLDCNGSLLHVAMLAATSSDPNPADNFFISTAFFDKGPVTVEDCDTPWDDDCDGELNCADSDCAGSNACAVSHTVSVYHGSPAGPQSDHGPFGGGGGAAGCVATNGRNGSTVSLPSYCCDGTANLVERFSTCNPFDPNFLESEDPPVNALGYGPAQPGQVIHYRVHYENIGGVDAHGVQAIAVLDPNLDENTLVIDNGGVYDSATRTILWVDPIVFPHDPRSVTYAIALRADAPILTHARSVATIVFPDANPPTRMDTNIVEHFVPDPARPIAPDPYIYACQQLPGSDEWRPQLWNRGSGFMYGVSARIVDPPAWLKLGDDAVDAFDTAGDARATIPPLSIAAAADPVRFMGIHGDPCDVLTWEISYQSSTGQAVTVRKRLSTDDNGNGIADWRESPSPSPIPSPGGNSETGCGCSVGGLPGPSPVWLLLPVGFVLFRRRD